MKQIRIKRIGINKYRTKGWPQLGGFSVPSSLFLPRTRQFSSVVVQEKPTFFSFLQKEVHEEMRRLRAHPLLGSQYTDQTLDCKENCKQVMPFFAHFVIHFEAMSGYYYSEVDNVSRRYVQAFLNDWHMMGLDDMQGDDGSGYMRALLSEEAEIVKQHSVALLQLLHMYHRPALRLAMMETVWQAHEMLLVSPRMEKGHAWGQQARCIMAEDRARREGCFASDKSLDVAYCPVATKAMIKEVRSALALVFDACYHKRQMQYRCIENGNKVQENNQADYPVSHELASRTMHLSKWRKPRMTYLFETGASNRLSVFERAALKKRVQGVRQHPLLHLSFSSNKTAVLRAVLPFFLVDFLGMACIARFYPWKEQSLSVSSDFESMMADIAIFGDGCAQDWSLLQKGSDMKEMTAFSSSMRFHLLSPLCGRHRQDFSNGCQTLFASQNSHWIALVFYHRIRLYEYVLQAWSASLDTQVVTTLSVLNQNWFRSFYNKNNAYIHSAMAQLTQKEVAHLEGVLEEEVQCFLIRLDNAQARLDMALDSETAPDLLCTL